MLKKSVTVLLLLTMFILIGCSTTTSEQARPTAITAAYIGNSNTMKFHKLTCKWTEKIASYNQVEFSTRQEAINEGYVPCKVCKP